MHQLKRLTVLAGIVLATAACTDVPDGGITAPAGARLAYYAVPSAVKAALEDEIRDQIACLLAEDPKQAANKLKEFEQIVVKANKSSSDPKIIQAVKDQSNNLLKWIEAFIASGKLGDGAVCDGQSLDEAFQKLSNQLYYYSGQYDEIVSGDGQTSKVCLTTEDCVLTTMAENGNGAILIIPAGSFLFPVLVTIDFNATCPDGYQAFGTPASPCVDFSVAGNFTATGEGITRAVCVNADGAVLLRYNGETWELLDPVVLAGYKEFCEFHLPPFLSRAPSNPVLAFASRVAAYLGEVLGPKILHAIDRPPAGGIGPALSPHIAVAFAFTDTGLDALCDKTTLFSPSTANAACTHLARAAQCAVGNDVCWNGALNSFIGVIDAQSDKNDLSVEEANELICDANALKRPPVLTTEPPEPWLCPYVPDNSDNS